GRVRCTHPAVGVVPPVPLLCWGHRTGSGAAARTAARGPEGAHRSDELIPPTVGLVAAATVDELVPPAVDQLVPPAVDQLIAPALGLLTARVELDELVTPARCGAGRCAWCHQQHCAHCAAGNRCPSRPTCRLVSH